MPTYFFDTEIHGDRSLADEGIVLPDLSVAKREAVRALYGLAAEVEADSDLICASVHVRDVSGADVLVLDMNLTVSTPPTTLPS